MRGKRVSLKRWSSTVSLFIFVCISQSWSQAAGEGRITRMMERLENIGTELELSDQQRVEVNRLVADFRSSHGDEIVELRDFADQLRESRNSGNASDADRIRTDIRVKIAELKSDGNELRKAVLAVLTPEQKDQLKSMKPNSGDRTQRRDGAGEGHSGKLRRLLLSLDLTADQKKEIWTLVETFRSESEGLREESRERVATLNEQLKKGDRSGARETKEELKSILDQVQSMRRELRNRILDLLTAEQTGSISPDALDNILPELD